MLQLKPSLLSFLVLVGLMWRVHLASSRATENNPNSCTYSFFVPQGDIVSTCKSLSAKEIDSMQTTILDLKRQVAQLQTTSGASFAAVSCKCAKDTKLDIAFKDCLDVLQMVGSVSGVYPVVMFNDLGPLLVTQDEGQQNKSYVLAPDIRQSIDVYCDLSDDMAWTVIMRRVNFDVSFDRGFEDYKNGFGEMASGGDFWMGLEDIHQMTNNSIYQYTLWVVLHDARGVPHVLPYDKFTVGPEQEGYPSYVSGYQGKVTDYFVKSNGKPFITKDATSQTEWSNIYKMYSDQDHQRRNIPSEYMVCAADAQKYSSNGGGGWWIYSNYYDHGASNDERNCGRVNLNALQPHYSSLVGITKVEMKIRRITPTTTRPRTHNPRPPTTDDPESETHDPRNGTYMYNPRPPNTDDPESETRDPYSG